jgi:predicted amidohydrolase
LSTFELDWWKCGLYICFDVRFPRLFETYKEKWVECMIGLYNWLEWEGKKEAFQYLAKARAHENQYFVVWIDRSWEDPNTWYTSSSIIATPTWKDIKETKQQIFHFGTLDKKEIKRISKFMPLQRSIKKEYNIKSSI